MLAVPDGVDEGVALALLVQGVTAWHLVQTCGRVQPGETVVVHAAAGGVGSLAVQLARRAGARVIATASTDESERSRSSWAPTRRLTRIPTGSAARLIEANGGERVDVVLEMIGGEVFRQSLGALGRSAGSWSTARPPTSRARSRPRGSSRAAAPSSASGSWTASAATICWRSRSTSCSCSYRPVSCAGWSAAPTHSPTPRAHRDLEQRRTTGKQLLDPTS